MVIEELNRGEGGIIYIFKTGEDEDSFLEDLERDYPKDIKQLVAMFRRFCSHGNIYDETKYKPLSKTISEFKPGNVRVLSFRLPGNKPVQVVLTGYFKKPKNKKLYQPHIDRAEKIAAEIIELYEANKLKIIRRDES